MMQIKPGKAQINFHKRIGLTPSFCPSLENYGTGVVLVLRLWWSALTLTIIWPVFKREVI